MKRIKEACDDIYEKSTLCAQTLRDNAVKTNHYSTLTKRRE